MVDWINDANVLPKLDQDAFINVLEEKWNRCAICVIYFLKQGESTLFVVLQLCHPKAQLKSFFIVAHHDDYDDDADTGCWMPDAICDKGVKMRLSELV